VIAPEYDEAGLEAMRQKPATRILVDRSAAAPTSPSATTSG
jgi:hypothetical protein